MTTFPNSPKLLKGGIALLDPTTGSVLKIIPLQYNPDTLTRSFKIKGVGAESGDRIEALRLTGPPAESIKVDVEIDATDQLEFPAQNQDAVQSGLHSNLAVLEMMVYPSSAHLIANNSQASSGNLEIIPAETSLTVFIFGPQRIVPVRITECNITEEAFDPSLNPIRAKISLGMAVLTVDDVGFNKKGGGLFLAYLQTKEQFASKYKSGSLNTLGVSGI